MRPLRLLYSIRRVEPHLKSQMSIQLKTSTSTSLSRLLRNIGSPFICETCQQKRGITYHQSRNKLLRHTPRLSKRNTTNIAPVSAINAAKSIPDPYKELHNALSALGVKAAVYINLSQLQLALKGLESGDPVTRVALLDTHGENGARQLVSLLLADPLEPEAAWEVQLNESAKQDKRALLIRYGETYEVDQKHPIIRTLSIPSARLQRYKIEILISDTSPHQADVLASELQSPKPISNRPSRLAYPVLKTILYGETLLEMTQILGRTLGIFEFEKGMVQGVFNTTWKNGEDRHLNQGLVLVDIDKAQTALRSFRRSLANAYEYEHGWLESGVPDAFDWLVKGIDSQGLEVKPVIRSLIDLLVERVQASIATEKQQREYQLASVAVADSVRHELTARVRAWSAHGHRELRDQLDTAFQNKNWRRLAWWKLLWHIDDVGIITEDVLQNSWLNNAEKEIIWLFGRIQGAGLLDVPTNQQNIESREASGPVRPGLGSLPPPPRVSRHLLDSRRGQSLYDPSNPWPQQISVVRNSLSSSTIPSLQAQSQRLLLQTLSTTAISSILSALIYVSLPSTSVFEAGAVAAFGLMLSLRRLQTKWDTTKRFWQGNIREEGRKVLNELEGIVKTAVTEGGKVAMDDVEIENRREAEAAVQKVKEALAKSSQS